MKKLVLLCLLSAAPVQAEESCFLVKELKSGRTVEQSGALCKKRLPPCSTFKLPLAVMAIDAGVLDEKTVLKWDKTPQRLKGWEQDADAKTWLRESIVWFSQRLTPLLGAARVQSYLRDFQYGNQDFSGGLTTAWLDSSLTISAEEQVAMLLKLKNGRSEAARRAIALLPTEGDIHGKTGSCANDQRRVGWYIGYFRDRAFTYVFEAARDDAAPYAGLEAKQRVIDRFTK